MTWLNNRCTLSIIITELENKIPKFLFQDLKSFIVHTNIVHYVDTVFSNVLM